MIRRIARTAVITVFSLKEQLKANVKAPRKQTAKMGIFPWMHCVKNTKEIFRQRPEIGTRE